MSLRRAFFDSSFFQNSTINFYVKAGADREKLVLGIPTYGRSYTLFNEESNEIGAPADGPGQLEIKANLFCFRLTHFIDFLCRRTR